ncbi:MAG: hypothetical protein WBO46_22535 [Caldilineaceae bacterium]
MTGPLKAAIDLDAIGQKTLTEISAADFLAALEQSDVSIRRLVGLPEKKKVEFWSEPETVPDNTVGDLLSYIRNEKKKLELESEPDFENWQKIREVRYSELVARIAADVEVKLRPLP